MDTVWDVKKVWLLYKNKSQEISCLLLFRANFTDRIIILKLETFDLISNFQQGNNR